MLLINTESCSLGISPTSARAPHINYGVVDPIGHIVHEMLVDPPFFCERL
jgi:hypothetical protein